MVNVYRDPAKTAADSPYAEPTPALTPEGAAARRYPAGSAEAKAQKGGERQLNYDVVAYGTSVEERARAVEAARRATVVGTPEWYAYQIVARDTQARETTVSKPGQANLSRPTSEQAIVTAITNRPRSVDVANFGDRKTQQLLSAVPEGDRAAALGVILEQQRQEATKTPTLTDDRFFQNQLNLWNAQAIEGSAGEHAYKKSSPNPADWTANVRENLGDIALVVEKAGNPKDNFGKNYAFNKNVASATSVLPQRTNADGTVTPVGLQEYAWMGAVSGKSPGNVSWMPAINYLNSQRGRQGVYGNLAGGVPDEFTPLPAGYSNGGMIHQPTIAAPDRLIGGGKVGGLGVVSDRKEGFTYTPIGKTLPTSGNQPPMIPNTFSRSEDWIGNLPVFGWIFGMIPGAVDLQTAVLPTSKAEGMPFLGNIARDASRPLMTEYTSEIKPSALSVMAGGKEDFKVKMSTTAKGYETAPWIPSKGTTYTGGSPELTEMEKHITAEQIGISAGQANIASLGKGNISGGCWTGSQSGLDTYNRQSDALGQRINKYNATLPQYDALAKANPIYATKYDMSKGVLGTGKTKVIGDTQFRSFEKGLIAETYGKVLPEHINLQSSTGKPLPLDTPLGLGHIAGVADAYYGYFRNNPFEALGIYATTAGLAYGLGVADVGVARAAQSKLPVIGTAGRMASTPLAMDVSTIAKGVVGAYFVYSAGKNIVDQPTAEKRDIAIGETAAALTIFSTAWKANAPTVAPVNLYKGKTFFTGEVKMPFTQKIQVNAATLTQKVKTNVFKSMTGEPGITSQVIKPGVIETLIKKIPTRDQIKYKYVEMKEPGSAMSVPAASERFVSTVRSTGDFTGSAKPYFKAKGYSEAYGKPRTGGSVSSRPTMAQAQSGTPLLDDGLGGMQRIYGDPNIRYGMKEPMLVRPVPATSSVGTVLGKPPSGMRGSQLGRWDTPLAIEDPMLNVPLKARWKIREGGYVQSGSSGGYYGSGTPTGNIQSGVGVGGTSVRSGRQFLEIRALSSGMEGPLQDLAPQRLEITPSRQTAMRNRAEGLSYEYESRQLPPGMQRPSPSISETSQIIKPTMALKVTPKVTTVQYSPSLLSSVQKVDAMSVSTQAQKQMSVVLPFTALRQGQISGVLQVPGTLQTQISDTLQIQSVKQIVGQEQKPRQITDILSLTKTLPGLAVVPVTTTLPKITPVLKPMTRPNIVPVVDYFPRIPPPKPPVFPLTFPSLGGSGMSPIRGGMRYRKYTEVMVPMNIGMPRMPKITLPGKPRLKVVKKKRRSRK